MAETRPYVINANVIKLLNSAPVANMRPSLGSLVQRKTIDIGCYPFPFMVNSDNVPLDGRTVVVNGESTRLPIRPVPYWCSENTYARYYGDPTYNNGIISWAGKIGYLKSKIAGNDIKGLSAFEYDSVMGVSFPSVRYNTAFIGMDNTVSQEWVDIRDAAFAPNGFDEVLFPEGATLTAAKNILFKIWSGLTFEVRDATDPNGGVTYGFLPMENFIQSGGTYSPFLDRYNYGCLDQIFNSDRFATIGLDPNDFWEGIGASYGVSGGMTGELFLLNALTGGDNAGSLYVLSPGASLDFQYNILFGGVSGGNTLSGRNFALNLYSVGNDPPFIGSGEQFGGFIDTMALLLGTNQKFANLTTGQTASLRALDFNNPCSASFTYRNDTELGRWGYDVQRLPIGEDIFTPGPPPEIGCNVETFTEYLQGATAKAQGNLHPLSWMFWKGIKSGDQLTGYSEGFVHDFVGLDSEDFHPIYNKLEGIHDHLCYEFFDNTGLKSRVYYPLRPITKGYYDTNVAPLYDINLDSGALAQAFGSTLSTRHDTAFPDTFKGDGSVNLVDGAISLRNLDADLDGINLQFPGTNNLDGVTGILFPYFIPLASFAMEGINTGTPVGSGDLTINGEFNNFADWAKIKFGLEGTSDPVSLYQYYADGVSSAADTNPAVSPYTVDLEGSSAKPNFRLFSWNALSRISPREFPLTEDSQVVKSSFKAVSGNDAYGKAQYTNPNTLSLDGSLVDVDPLHYPPAALPTGFGQGLTYSILDGSSTVVEPLECASFINVIRYANNNAPNEAPVGDAFGLTADRKLISQVVLGASEQTFTQFDPDKNVETTNASKSFSRAGSPTIVPNMSSNFFVQTAPDKGNFKNFFFTTSADEPILGVFDGRYYLTAEEYFNKYINANSNLTWWQNIDTENLAFDAGFDLTNGAIIGIAASITDKLLSGSGNWALPSSAQSGFRGNAYDPFADTVGGNGFLIGGVEQAIADGLHPAFVYRIFTTNVIQNLGLDEETSCIQTWRNTSGVPCDQILEVSDALKTNGGVYNSYFSGSTGCNDVGNEFTASEFSTQKGKDFFGKCAIRVQTGGPGGGSLVYAYDDYWYAPLPTTDSSNPFFVYQNINCAGGSSIQDPPMEASLSIFGSQFAEALKIAENKPDVNLADPLQVRDQLFAFPGNTASLDGSSNNVGTVNVGNWLQGKLKSIFDYWNNHRTDGDQNLQAVESVLFSLYPSEFQAYKDSFANSSTYKLWAIKPKCVEQWTPECADLAQKVQNTNTFRSAVFAPAAMFFQDETQNSHVPSPQKIGRMVSTFTTQRQNTRGTNNPIPQLTTSDIQPLNEGFMGAFNTYYLEPAGRATNVIASEIQTLPRAVVTSTVFGKLGTVIDSTGFIRDVNVITFESGFGTKILGDNTTGTLSFSVDGLTMGSLTDTEIIEPATGDILIYDAELGKWINRSFADIVQPFLAGFTGFTGSFEPGTNFFYQDTAPDAGITIGSRWMNSNSGIEYIYINDGDSFQWIQSSVDVMAETPTYTYNTTLVTGSEYVALDTDYYIGVSYAGEALIQLPSNPSEGKTVIVKDASGMASYGNRKITVIGADAADTIDNEESAIINVNNGALQFIYKNGWRII